MDQNLPSAPPKVYNTHVFTISVTSEPNPRKCLMKDGRQVICHKQPPLIMQRNVQVAGQPSVDIVPVPCSTDCGKANIMQMVHPDGKETISWRQSCDSIGLEVNVMDAKEAEEFYKEQEKLNKEKK